jgi:hypothetical protein
MLREIWLSTHVSKDIPGGFRSVIALHGDTGLPRSAGTHDEQPAGVVERSAFVAESGCGDDR